MMDEAARNRKLSYADRQRIANRSRATGIQRKPPDPDAGDIMAEPAPKPNPPLPAMEDA